MRSNRDRYRVAASEVRGRIVHDRQHVIDRQSASGCGRDTGFFGGAIVCVLFFFRQFCDRVP